MSGQYMQIAVVIVMIAAVLFFFSDVRKWNSLQSLISHRVKILRVILLAIVETLLVLLLIGPPRHDTQLQLSYWSFIVALALGIVVVALWDVREVMQGLRRLNKEVFDSLKEDRDKK